MPESQFAVEPFRAEDAEQVPALFRHVYGDAYPVDMVYEPEALIAAHREGRIFPFVVRTPANRVVAYGALYRSAPHQGIYEFGQGAVHAEFRSSGLGRLLFEFASRYLPTLSGAEMYFGEAVCSHTTTQKAGALIHTIEMGVEVDLLPASLYEQLQPGIGTVSVVDMFRTYVPGPHTIYLPRRYEEILRRIYDGFDDERTLIPCAGAAPSTTPSTLSTQLFDSAGVARIQAATVGADFERVIESEIEALVRRQARVIQVWLPLADPAVERHTESLRSRGFFFAGAFPRWFREDALLLQRIEAEPNWGAIRIYSSRTEEILRHIKSDWETCAKARPEE